MPWIFAFTLSAFSFALSSQVPYYGEEFYQKYYSRPSVEKSVLSSILTHYHELRSGKFDLVNAQCQPSDTCVRYNALSYDHARRIIFGELDKRQDPQGTYVEDVYCQKKVYFKDLRSVTENHHVMNVEHTWPQSKFNKSHPKDVQKSDMHHLFPVNSDANNRRANHDFGDIGEHERDELDVPNCSASKLADIDGHFIFTPPATHKGNVARALFYFSTRYDLNIHPAAEMILRSWHKQDPVDAAELARHDMIVKIQRVRNPFIDHPELVEKVKDF